MPLKIEVSHALILIKRTIFAHEFKEKIYTEVIAKWLEHWKA